MYRRRGLGSTVDDALSAAASKYGIPLSLLRSVAKTESAFNPNAVSSAGAQGLMQIMPGTQGDLGVTNPFDPFQSADGGAKYLQQLYQKFGNWDQALIAYNEGPATLSRGVIYPGSQSYADSILSAAGPLDSSSATVTDDSETVAAAVETFAAGLSPLELAGLGLAVVGVLWAMTD